MFTRGRTTNWMDLVCITDYVHFVTDWLLLFVAAYHRGRGVVSYPCVFLGANTTCLERGKSALAQFTFIRTPVSDHLNQGGTCICSLWGGELS